MERGLRMRRIDDEVLVQQLLDQLSSVAPADRLASVDRLCANRPHLRGVVRQRLESLYIGSTSADAPETKRYSDPTWIGDYEVVRRLGQGSFAAVFLCRDQSGAATGVKLFDFGLPTKYQQSRFERETRALRSLDHPGIAQYQDSGETSIDGRIVFFLAMEYVPGNHIDEYVRASDLSTRQRIRLFLKVCKAVSHAHEKGIVHRDLKPSNIVVTPSGDPKVLDFGIVRFAGSSLDTITAQADGNAILGSLPYISPEQALDPHRATENCDVYSLGVLLFELLTGELPINIRGVTFTEAIAAIHNAKRAPLSKYGQEFRGGLENIVGKALAHDSEERYQSVAELDDDLCRYLEGGRVQARQPSFRQQVIKLVKQFPRQAVAVLTLVTLVAVLGVSAAYFGVVSQSRLKVVTRQTTLAADRLQQLERSRYNSVLLRAFDDLAYDPQVVAETLNNSRECPGPFREFAWNLLASRAKRVGKSINVSQRISAVAVAVHTGSRIIIIGDRDGDVNLIDADTSKLLRRIVNKAAPIRALDVSSDQSRVLIGDNVGHVLSVSLMDADPPVIDLYKHDGPIRCVAFLPNSNKTLSVCNQGLVRVWSEADHKIASETTLPTGLMHCAISSDGKVLVAQYRNHSPVFLDLQTMQQMPSEPIPQPTIFASALGSTDRFAVTEQDGTIGFWKNGQRDEDTWRLPSRAQRLTSSLDGSQIVAACWESGVFLRHGFDQGSSFRLLRLQKTRRHPTVDVAISPDATWLCVALPNTLITWWLEPLAPTLISTFPQTFVVAEVFPRAEANRIAWADTNGDVSVVRADNFKRLSKRETPHRPAFAIAVDPSGSLIATSHDDNKIYVSDVADGRVRLELAKHSDSPIALAFSHDGRDLFSGGRDKHIHWWDLDSGTLKRTLEIHDGRVRKLACSPDGRTLVSIDRQNRMVGYDLASTSQRWHLELENRVTDLKFMPSSEQFIIGDGNGVVALWDAETGERVVQLLDVVAVIRGLAISPDGLTLAVGDDSGIVTLLDPRTGQVRLRLDAKGQVKTLAFANRGQQLLVANRNNQMLVWDAVVEPGPTDGVDTNR